MKLSLVFFQLHLHWLTALCVCILSCFLHHLCAQQRGSCLHVYLCRVNDSVISWNPSSRRHSELTYRCLLSQAEPKVSSTRPNPSNFTCEFAQRNCTQHPLSETHTYTQAFLGNCIFCNHPSLKCTLEYNAIWARSHTQTSDPSLSLLQAKILSHSYVHKQGTIHSSGDREINKCQE